MAPMFNLRNVLELIGNGFNNDPLAQEELIGQTDQPLFQGAFDRSQQFDALLQQDLGKRLGQVALIANELAEEALRHVRDWTPIIPLAWREPTGQQFSLIVDQDVEREAIEPAHRVLATSCQAGKDSMLPNAAIMTDGQGWGVDERQAATDPLAGLSRGAERHQDRRNQADKAWGTDQSGELATQVNGDILGVIGFEGAVMRLVEMDENRHHVALTQLADTPPLDHSRLQWGLVPTRSKGSPEIIDTAEQCE